MAKKSITRLASAAVVTGIATLALAAPASAAFPKDPAIGGDLSRIGDVAPVSTNDSGWELVQVATGAVGGLALAGIGVAAAAGLRRHHDHLAHPA